MAQPSLKKEWGYILENRIAADFIGEHDPNNRFLAEDTRNWMKEWKFDHEGCTPIGICYDPCVAKYGCYHPMVYEDENGDRFYTHVGTVTLEEIIELEEKGEKIEDE